jgi:predicted ArsR family transcriptional regulator
MTIMLFFDTDYNNCGRMAQRADFQQRKRKVLEFMKNSGEVTVRDIADYSGITTQSAGTLVKTMRDRGLIEWVNFIGTVGRPASVYEITGEGEKKLAWLNEVNDVNYLHLTHSVR